MTTLGYAHNLRINTILTILYYFLIPFYYNPRIFFFFFKMIRPPPRSPPFPYPTLSRSRARAPSRRAGREPIAWTRAFYHRVESPTGHAEDRRHHPGRERDPVGQDRGRQRGLPLS